MPTAAAAPTIDALRAEEEAAAIAREQAHAVPTDIEPQLARMRTLVDPNLARVSHGAVPNLEEVLTAHADLPALEQRWAAARLDAHRADQRHEAAKAALRDAL